MAKIPKKKYRRMKEVLENMQKEIEEIDDLNSTWGVTKEEKKKSYDSNEPLDHYCYDHIFVTMRILIKESIGVLSTRLDEVTSKRGGIW